MVKLIVHLSDLHVRNKIRHDEYCEQFERFVIDARKQVEGLEYGEARIVISGDIVHQKNTITNELITLVPNFIRELEKIAPVVVIAGNHDLLMTNLEKQDTISAIFEAADFQHTTFVDREAGYRSGLVTDDNIIWALYSIYDGFRAPDDIALVRQQYPDALILGLFHDTVAGSIMDSGLVSEDGVSHDRFTGCNYVLAGHIHKRQVLSKGGIQIVYPGSLIQQDYGESVQSHGYAIWRINGNKASFSFVDLPTEYGQYKFTIDSDKDIDEDKERLVNFN